MNPRLHEKEYVALCAGLANHLEEYDPNGQGMSIGKKKKGEEWYKRMQGTY